MKKAVIFWLLGPAFSACTASNQIATKTRIHQEEFSAETNFATQGPLEAKWAQTTFQKHYEYKPAVRFQGTVQARVARQEQVFRYGADTLSAFDVDDRFLSLFADGILYPTVHPEYYLNRVSTLKELAEATKSPKHRLFTMYVWNRLTVNPTLYVFELTNDQARLETNLTSFLQGAVLTFIHEVGGVI
ncbi:hypothetical protein I2I05_14015 [Hymenobacter sp. BT683]|uniref:Lipoprotein n=1 Tax=Hymenobacter jeongseonensis TaxID=2791027 RepID=A0ABS0IJG1_9BACT|nr:hypothetical protein [Hymenobacter jeongseonensis]MBF9238517.1 hypothetical protein [Hymenobacter jeongseonensis]